MTFDGPNKLVILTSANLSLIQLWSRYKDWLLGGGALYALAYDTEGGRPIDPVAGTLTPLTVFQQNGWKIRPMESDHTVSVTDGTLVGEAGGDPFVSTVGDYTVRIRYQQPVQAIGYSTTGGTAGPTAAEIAAEVLAVLQASVIPANVKQVNDTLLTGSGIVGDEWGPA